MLTATLVRRVGFFPAQLAGRQTMGESSRCVRPAIERSKHYKLSSVDKLMSHFADCHRLGATEAYAPTSRRMTRRK